MMSFLYILSFLFFVFGLIVGILPGFLAKWTVDFFKNPVFATCFVCAWLLNTWFLLF